MPWVNLSGAFGYGTILTSTQMQNLRDNLPAIAAGAILGLALSNDSDTAHDIAIATGICTDATYVDALVLASILTKQIDVDWVAGDDAGGFPSGLTLAGSGPLTYHVFLIKNTTTNIVDAGFDSSLTAVNLLSDASGYTLYRRIGSIRVDGSDNIIGFSQVGDEFLWDDPPLDLSAEAQDTTAITRTLTVPIGIPVHVIFNLRNDDATGLLYISPLDVNDEAPTTNLAPLGSMYGGAIFKGRDVVRTNTSGQIRTRADGAGNIYLATLGWIDRRGKDD